MKTLVMSNVDPLAWARWFEDHQQERQIGRNRLGKVLISTVFLGLDHNMREAGDPILFETMVFGGALDGEQWRYASYAEAERGHAAAVDQVKIAQAKIKSIADKAGA